MLLTIAGAALGLELLYYAWARALWLELSALVFPPTPTTAPRRRAPRRARPRHWPRLTPRPPGHWAARARRWAVWARRYVQ